LSLRDRIDRRLHQFLQQRAPILEQRRTQSDLDGLEIVDALLGHCRLTMFRKAWVSLNRSSWYSAGSRRFFPVVNRRLQLGYLIGKRELFGRGIEKPEVLHLLFDLPGPGGGNPLGTLLPLN
jgi:hypothetical protein